VLLQVAQMYRDGEGEKQDLTQAKYWFTRSAELGNAKAKKELQQLCMTFSSNLVC